MINILQLDRTVLSWINRDCSNPVLDVIMPLVTHLGDSSVVWLWIGGIGLVMSFQLAPRFRNRPRSAMIKAVGSFCLFMTVIYVVNAGVYGGLKHLIQRPRPFAAQAETVRLLSDETRHLHHSGSFPSGHANNAFMIAVLLAGRLRRGRWAIFGVAFLVALSRVYLGVHYPSDVIAGACLGSVITWFMVSFRSPDPRC